MNRLRTEHETNQLEMREAREVAVEAQEKKVTVAEANVMLLMLERDLAKQRNRILDSDMATMTNKVEVGGRKGTDAGVEQKEVVAEHAQL